MAAPTIAQSKNTAHSGFSTFDLVFDSNVTAGNTIAVYLFANDATPPTVSSITDTLANTYTAVDTVAGSSGTAFSWYAKNITGGACTITIVLSAENFTVWIAGVEVAGADTTAPLSGNAMAADEDPGTTTDAVTSGAITPTADNSLLLGFTAEAGFSSTITVGTGWTLVASGAADGRTIESLAQTTAASQAATFTSSGGGADYVTSLLAFKAAAGGGGSTPALTINRHSLRPNAFAPGLAR